MLRTPSLVVLATTLTFANLALTRGAIGGESLAVEASSEDPPKVVARWKHQPGNNVNTLYSNGKINDPSGEHTWTLKNGVLVLRWKDVKAPGGFWVDTCKISPDGLTYKGSNQLRHPISGVLVADPPARLAEKPNPNQTPPTAASGLDLKTKPRASVGLSSEDVWKVLQLVSLDYELNFKKVARDHSLLPLVPLMTSQNARVRQVAALSAKWEIDVWELQKAFKNRVGSVEGFLGFSAPRPANAKPDPVQPETPPEVKSALAKADREGLLEIYKTIDSGLKKVNDEGKDNLIGPMSQSSAEYYRTQLVVALKQAVLWSRAEALAKATANGNNSRGNDVEVMGVFERGNTWGSVVVRNKSRADLDHITLAFLAPKKALSPGSPGLDFLLGASLGGGVDSNNENVDPKELSGKFKAGLNLVGAVANDRTFREMPVRVFVHIPKLIPNAECEIRLFRSSAEFGATTSATYSVWADGVAMEGKPLPGYEAAKHNKTSPGLNPTVTTASDPKDPFPKGSVWRGTVKWIQAGSPDLTRSTEITVTARNGKSFKGLLRYSGNGANGAPSNIVGEVSDGTISWEFVSSGGKAGLLHTGTIKEGRIEAIYEEGGEKPRKSITVLSHVPTGKR